MKTNKSGFSLVELMIVVAIIGILAAVAIPSYISYQLKTKRAEVPGNVDGIKTAELAYDATYDAFLTTGLSPAGTIGKTLQDFDYTQAGWSQLGWRPDGQVRGHYQAVLTGGSGGTAEDFTVMGESDVDGDSNLATYLATTSVNATLDPAEIDVY